MSLYSFPQFSVLLVMGVMSVTGNTSSSGATTTTAGEKNESADGGKSLSISSSMSVADNLDMSNGNNKQGQSSLDTQPQLYSANSEQFGLRKDHSAQQQQQIYSFVSQTRPSFDYSDSQLEASESGKYSSQIEPADGGNGNSPASSYYAKVTADDNNNSGETGQQAQHDETIPMSSAMSVDEAFRKYFPGSKPQQMAESQGHPVETSYNNAQDNEVRHCGETKERDIDEM